jgi:hypothetical protein
MALLFFLLCSFHFVCICHVYTVLYGYLSHIRTSCGYSLSRLRRSSLATAHTHITPNNNNNNNNKSHHLPPQYVLAPSHQVLANSHTNSLKSPFVASSKSSSSARLYFSP